MSLRIPGHPFRAVVNTEVQAYTSLHVITLQLHTVTL